MVNLLRIRRLAGGGVLAGQKKAESHIEAIMRCILLQGRQDFLCTTELLKNRIPQLIGVRAGGLRVEIVIQTPERLVELSAGAINLGQVVIEPSGELGMLGLGFRKNPQGAIVLAVLDADVEDTLVGACR